MQFEWYELSKKIIESKNIVISGHMKPDGDSIGACLGMAIALNSLGKDVYVLLEQYPKAFDMIPGKELIKTPEGDIDLFIALDCADKERLGDYKNFFDKAKYTVNIDHHISNTMFADKNYVNPYASATCEIVYEAIISDFLVDKDIASALYAGIIYDTGGLRHASTTAETFLVVSKLLAFQIPFTEIATELFYKHSYSQAKLLAKAINNISQCKNVAYTSITTDEIRESNSSLLETDGIVDYIKNIDDIEIAVFFYQLAENEIKASFRSDVGYNVCTIATKFGGGGHINASGCTVNMTMSEAIGIVMAEVEKLNAQGKIQLDGELHGWDNKHI